MRENKAPEQTTAKERRAALNEEIDAWEGRIRAEERDCCARLAHAEAESRPYGSEARLLASRIAARIMAHE